MAEQTNPQGTRQFSQSMDTVSVEPAATSRVAAELLVNVLRGSPMLLSSTQAIDGTHFLKLAGGEDHDAFLELLRTGRIAVHLPPGLNHSTLPLCELLARKAESHNFELCGWPEIPCSRPGQPDATRTELARQLRSAVDNKSQKEIEDKTMRSRWQALRRVDEVLTSPKGHIVQSAYLAGPTVRERIVTAAREFVPDEEIKLLLHRLAALEADSRSDYYHHIREAGWSRAETRKAREIVDCAYNLVVANSLGSGATVNTHSGGLATMLRRNAADEPVRIAEHHGDVKGMSWADAIRLNDMCHDSSLSLERRAEELDEFLDGAIKRMAEVRDSTISFAVGKAGLSKLLSVPATTLGAAVLGAGQALLHASPKAYVFTAAAASWPAVSAMLKAKYKWDIGAAELAEKSVDRLRRPGVKRRIQLLLDGEADRGTAGSAERGGTLEPGAPTR